MKNDLYEKLKEYGSSGYYPFHMPGHKRNRACDPFGELYQYDITEVDGFDNLHRPEGILKAAMQRAAVLYQSEETYYLINGSTVGILSAVSAVAGRGRKLIAARNCHRAVYHAAFLNHLEMEYLYPPVIAGFGLAGGISAVQAEQKIKESAKEAGISLEKVNTLIAGIVLTSPTYDGILSDVAGITDMAHRYGIPVIVDQAHGAHFGFHKAFPENGVAQGADLVIHSVHKTLPAPTQTALLHRNGTLVQGEIIRKYLSVYQSSSPSYILMAGIDSCMALVEEEAEERLEKLLLYRKELIEKTKNLRYIKVYPSMAEKQMDSLSGQDIQEPGRLAISVKGSSVTGQQFYDILRETYHLQMEMAAADYVIAILSMMDTREGIMRLADAICEIDRSLSSQIPENAVKIPTYQQHSLKTALPVSEAFMAETFTTDLKEAEGEIAADFINLYPPGIPIVVPGEKLDQKIIEIIQLYLANGYTLQGIDENIRIKVIRP